MRIMREIFLLGLVAVMLANNFNHDVGVMQSVENEAFYPQVVSGEIKDKAVDEVRELVKIDENRCGKKIAIIDSGVDVGIDELQGKVSSFKDFTSEGLVQSKEIIRQGEGFYVNGKYFKMDKCLSEYKFYRYASLNEDKFSLNILLLKDRDSWRVFADGNDDNFFDSSEEVLLYNSSKMFVELKNGYNLALTMLSDNGKSLQFSGDFLGHGTFMASTLVGNSKKYKGLLANDEVMMYKIFTKDAKAKQKALISALDECINDEVDIINLSLSLPLDCMVSNLLDEAFERVQKKGILVVAASGNYGAKVDSVAYPSTRDGVLCVGGFVPKSVCEELEEVVVEDDFVPSYMSVSGEKNKIDVIAPCMISGCAPSWYGDKYIFDEGSSVASVVATASVASGLQDGLSVEEIYAGVISATVSKGFSAIKEGFGMVQVPSKFYTGIVPKVSVSYENGKLLIKNDDIIEHSLRLYSSSDVPISLKIAPKATGVAKIDKENDSCESMAIKVVVDTLEVATSFLQVCEIRPMQFESFGENRCDFLLNAGEVENYYINIEESCNLALTLALKWVLVEDKSNPQAVGRCKVVVYAPSGKEYASDYIGSGSKKLEQKLNMAGESGIWQISVYCSKYLSRYNQLNSEGYVKLVGER